MNRRTASALAPALMLTLAPSVFAQRSADLDRNGALEITDVLEFQELLKAQDRRVDFNRDGSFDVYDYLEFQQLFMEGEPDSTTPVLYLGVGGHWSETSSAPTTAWSVGHDFGPTNMSYRWLSQTVLNIRAARHYSTGPSGSAITFAWADVTDSDPANWTLRKRAGGVDLFDDDAFNSWVAQALHNIDTDAFAVDPMSSGRKIQLDNETLHFLGSYWGRMMQAQPSTEVPLAHATTTLFDEHSTKFIPYGIGFMQALQAEYPNDEFTWYNLPASRNNSFDSTGVYWDDGYYGLPTMSEPVKPTDPWGPVDIEFTTGLSVGLLDVCDYIDGRVYIGSGSPVDTSTRWKDYWDGQISRKKAIADDLGKPFMARIWLEDGRQFNGLKIAAYVKTFFESCDDEGVTEAAVDLGRSHFECACELEGMTYGNLWNSHVVQAAYDGGYITDPPVFQLAAVSLTPDSGERGQSVAVTLRGSEFVAGTTFTISGSGVTPTTFSISDDKTMTAILPITNSAALGWRNLTVTDGVDSWTLEDAFEVLAVDGDAPAPTVFIDSNESSWVNCVGRSSVEEDSTTTIRLAGRHFQNGCDVTFAGTGVTVNSVTFIDSRRVDVNITVADLGLVANPVERLISLENPDSQSADNAWTLTITPD